MPLNRHTGVCCTDFVGHSVTGANILAVDNKISSFIESR